MKATIIKTASNGESTLKTVGFDELIKEISNANGIDGRWQVVTQAAMRKQKGKAAFVEYTGIVPLLVEGLVRDDEFETLSHEAQIMPQTFAVFRAQNNRSMLLLVRTTLPDGTLPKSEADAALFHAQAYQKAVMSYAPALSYRISIVEPLLDKGINLWPDPAPYYNPDALALLLEQPTSMPESLQRGSETERALQKGEPSVESYITMKMLFDAAMNGAIIDMGGDIKNDQREELLVKTVTNCVMSGIPEEETFHLIKPHFYGYDPLELRMTITNIYMMNEKVAVSPLMPSHQRRSIMMERYLQNRYEFRFNTLLDSVEYRQNQSLDFMFVPLTKRGICTIRHEAATNGITAQESDFNAYLGSDYIRKYNPVDNYLSHLPVWDGKDHIGQMADMVPNEHPHWKRLFSQWFLSMVAHWMNIDDEHSNNSAPVLVGNQGYRKSTFCRNILPPEMRQYYNDRIDFDTKKDAERSLTRFMLVNIDEFDQLTESQMGFVKYLFQETSVKARRMYSGLIETRRRYASFICTTNHTDILRDITGNRRFICVNVTAPIRTDIQIDYAQLYSQAVTLINQHQRYWLNDEDEALISEHNIMFLAHSPIEEILQSMFVIPEENEPGTWMTLPDIMGVIRKSPAYTARINNLSNLGKALRRLNAINRHTKAGNVYWLKATLRE